MAFPVVEAYLNRSFNELKQLDGRSAFPTIGDRSRPSGAPVVKGWAAFIMRDVAAMLAEG